MWAICAMAGMSMMSSPGLPMTSPNIILVFGRRAALKAAGSLGGTKVDSTPNRPKVCSNRLIFAPYICEEDTIWSPALNTDSTDRNSAAMPEDVATVPTPPSSAVSRCSRTATVGLVRRV